MTDPDVLALSPRIRFRAVDEEIGVLVHLERGTVVTMNFQGLRTLSLISELRSRSAVIDALVAENDVPVTEIERDLDHFLVELREQEILA